MTTPRRPRGFTLVELAIVVAIIAVVTTMAYAGFRTARQRSEISGLALDLRALLHQARAEALATGHDVAVMVFPEFQVPNGGVGRVIVYSDGDRTLFEAAAPINFENYNPSTTATGPRSEVLDVYNLPREFVFGPSTGQAPVTLAAPYASLPVNSRCTFCLNGTDRRGAVVFNHQGVARFQSANGPPAGPLAGVIGGSVSLQSTRVPDEVRTLAVVAATGTLRSIQSKLR